MKNIIFAFLLLVAPSVFAEVTIGVLDTGDGNPHQEKVVSLFKELLKNNSDIKIKTYPIYEANGDLNSDKMLQVLDQASKESTFLHLSWNLRSTEKTKAVENKISELTKNNVVVVGAAGAPERDVLVAKLSGTVLGKSDKVLIIGELSKKGHHLVSNSYYGPEMLTALEPPEGLDGSSFSSVIFSAELAKNWGKMKDKKLYDYFFSKKNKSSKLCPTLKELF